MNGLEPFLFDVAETESLVPAGREDVKRDLAADRVGEVVVRELFLEGVDKSGADLVFKVVPFVLMALLDSERIRRGMSAFGKPPGNDLNETE